MAGSTGRGNFYPPCIYLGGKKEEIVGKGRDCRERARGCTDFCVAGVGDFFFESGKICNKLGNCFLIC